MCAIHPLSRIHRGDIGRGTPRQRTWWRGSGQTREYNTQAAKDHSGTIPYKTISS